MKSQLFTGIIAAALLLLITYHHYLTSLIKPEGYTIGKNSSSHIAVICPPQVSPQPPLEEAAAKVATTVVMFVPTPVQWEDRRRNVYAQFAKEAWRKDQVVLLFIYGTRQGNNLSETVDTSGVVKYPLALNIMTECRDMDYGQEFNSPTDMSATTCKVYEAYKYIASQYETKYVWRGADDSYVNLRYFMRLLPTLPRQRLFMGWLRRADTVHTDLLLERQPALQKLYGLYQFGQYMLGMGFVMSYDVAEFIGTLKIPPHLTWCEDVMVGMWLNPFQVSFMHHHGFHCQNVDFSAPAAVGVDYLVVHRMKPHQWERIDTNGRFI